MKWMEDDPRPAPPPGGQHAGERACEAMSAGWRVRVIRNPRSHRNARAGQFTAPAGVEVIEPQQRGDTIEALRHCRTVGTDCLIIDGGDGTVRDVLSAGLAIFGDDWPVLGILPRGKTNALAADLGVPEHWQISDCAASAANGRTSMRRPLVLTRDGSRQAPFAGFLVGAGSFARGIEAAQEAHRMGMFGGLAVGATLAWVVAQIVFGGARNPWRRGPEMELELLPSGERLPHADHGAEAARRSLLVATTLRRLPMGIKPFGAERDGLKLLAVDRAHRRTYAAAPLILAGYLPDWLGRLGVHRRDADGLLVSLAERFILDGEFLEAGVWRIEQGPALRFAVP